MRYTAAMRARAPLPGPPKSAERAAHEHAFQHSSQLIAADALRYQQQSRVRADGITIEGRAATASAPPPMKIYDAYARSPAEMPARRASFVQARAAAAQQESTLSLIVADIYYLDE